MLLCALPVFLYVIKIGGDPRHYRYLAFPICLMFCAAAGILETALRRFKTPLGSAELLAVALGVMMLLSYPRQLKEHPFWLKGFAHWVDMINDATSHRQKNDLRYEQFSERVNPKLMKEYLAKRQEPFYRSIEPIWWCSEAYKRFDTRVVHSLGLTDAFLGRADAKLDRIAHRWSLVPMAEDMVKIEREAPVIGIGMFRSAIEKGAAPEWVVKNLETIEVIERKAFNRHDFMENLTLAFTFPLRSSRTAL